MASKTSLKRLCTIFTVLLYPPLALCHMQMNNPFPLRSPLDPQTPESLKDYNMVAPLNPSGSDFTCKGYQYNTPWRSTATYGAGETYNMSVVGGATHLGGSCQLSLSYDNGSTFKVIKSMIGGCPLTQSYEFTIPDKAPSGQALFAWTWFNHEGNREMYMNCAVVNIVGSNNYLGKRASMDALAYLPNLWVANLAEINSCKTVEGTDPVFPDPGTDVIYGGGMSSTDTASTDVGQCDGISITSSNSSPMYAAPSSPAARMGYVTPPSYVVAATSSTDMDMAMGVSYDPATATATSSDHSASTGDWNPLVDVNGGNGPGQDPVASPSDEPGQFNDVGAFRLWGPTSTCIDPPDVTVTVTPSSWPTQSPGCWGSWYSCGDCWWPSSCITDSLCSTKCGIQESTLHTATQEPTITGTANHTLSKSSSAGSSTHPPPPPPPPPPPHTSCTNNPPPYATGDPSVYLPCTPGTFLCTSSSNFLTCIQTNTGWTYGGPPRAVAAGMMCLPFLSPSTSPHKARGAAAAPNPQAFAIGPGPFVSNGPIPGWPQDPNCPPVPVGFYRDDKYVGAMPQGSCSPDGSFMCNGPSGFSVCNQGAWVDMGGVAAGTQCVNGQIVPI